MTHDAVRSELTAGTSPEVICATCPWDRLCITPPEMTPEQVKRKVREFTSGMKETDPAGAGAGTAVLIAASIYGGRDTMGTMCPVFVMRLRTDRGVADSIRDAMRNYSPLAGEVSA